jgi:hypothetical protein
VIFDHTGLASLASHKVYTTAQRQDISCAMNIRAKTFGPAVCRGSASRLSSDLGRGLIWRSIKLLPANILQMFDCEQLLLWGALCATLWIMRSRGPQGT